MNSFTFKISRNLFFNAEELGIWERLLITRRAQEGKRGPGNQTKMVAIEIRKESNQIMEDSKIKREPKCGIWLTTNSNLKMFGWERSLSKIFHLKEKVFTVIARDFGHSSWRNNSEATTRATVVDFFKSQKSSVPIYFPEWISQQSHPLKSAQQEEGFLLAPVF